MMDGKEKRTLQGKFHIAANGRKSYEIYYAVPDIIFEVSDILVAKYEFTQPDHPITEVDEVIARYRRENVVWGALTQLRIGA